MYNLITFLVRSILLNPMALLGVIGGAYGLYHYRVEGLLYLYKSPYLYGAIFLISLLYALIFKHIYHTDSKKINWMSTIKSSVNHLLTIIIVAFLTCIILILGNYILDGRFMSKIDQYLRNLE